ncbi:MAG: cation-transporting P-type ATPase, partial [Rhodoferax sp.]|nr:cation-transporting P-type ATPase [Rhodoferax sp.]
MRGSSDTEMDQGQQSSGLAGGHWHLQDAHELARQHGVDPAHGLLEEEASRRAVQHGPNEIRGQPGRGLARLFIDQFKDFMILVLIAAAVISGVIGDLIDTLAILLIVLLNAAIGFVQAWRADKAMAAL